MLSSDLRSGLWKGLFCFIASAAINAAELSTAPGKNQPKVAEASKEGEEAIKSLKLPPGFKAELIAAEPHAANIVSFHIDERGNMYVAETFRLHAGVTDIRSHMDWLDEDLAARTPDDRLAMMMRHMGPEFRTMGENEDRIRFLQDKNGDGKMDFASVFAGGFNHPLDGLASGVLSRKGDVYYTDLPNLWFLRDTNNDGIADFKKSLSYGYGVRVGFLGHDLHGLTFGPDGRLYFSIGDRGSAVKIGGKVIGDADSGSVFRCNPDGSGLEVFSFGLRNPQELAFDEFGNLFTGDNNSDGGDKARWVYLVEGSDCGWRVGFQHLNEPNSRGMWNSEKMWHPEWEGQAAYIVPPITNITSGPSGLTYYPGTGMPEKFKGHFFLADFRGGPGSSIHTFAVKPRGATFEVVEHETFVGEGLPTDVEFGVDGGLYYSDWVRGWGMNGKGRIYRIYELESAKNPLVTETKKLRAQGFEKRDSKELGKLLGHADQRVRQEAHFELASRGEKSLSLLSSLAKKNENRLARMHAIWGLWQLGLANVPGAHEPLWPLLKSDDAEVRAQAAKVLGDLRRPEAFAALMAMLNDAEPRPRFFAATALGRLGRSEAIPGLLNLARSNKDSYIRHAIVMGLYGIGDIDALLKAANDSSPAARMAVLLTLRRMERAEISRFLNDSDPLIVVEAARAINDVPISGAMRELAALKISNSTAPEVSRRVANANLRYATAESAKALVTLAKTEDLPNRIRIDALENLGVWEHPSGRDRITGLWRPTAIPRDVNHARQAMRPEIKHLLAQGEDQVRSAAARAAGKLQLIEAADELVRWIKEGLGTSRMRIEALNALAALDKTRLAQAAQIAMNDKLEDVRKEAIKFSSQSTDQMAAILQTGSIGEKQSALASLKGNDALISDWLDKLAKDDAPKELALDIIEAAEKRPELKDKAEKAIATLKTEPTLYGGNAEEGRKLFFERAELSCLRCHKIKGEGGEVGPDLSNIGARQSREYIHESIALPNKVIAQGFDSILVNLKNGTAYAGIVKNETATDLTLNSPEDGIVTVKKADIEKRAVGQSGMPEGLVAMINKQELRNLIEFLATQK